MTGIVVLVGMAAGSALGTALVVGTGPTVAFGVNAASFLFDVVLLSTIRLTQSLPAHRAPRPLRDGIEYVRRTPRVRNPLMGLAILGTFAFTVQVSVPILATEAFAGGSSLVGTALTAVTVGGLGGTLKTGRALNYLEAGDESRKLCSLYLGIMDRMGMKVSHFGDADTRLADL